MSPEFICVNDNYSFPSLEALEAHEKSGHQIKGTPTKTQPANSEFEETLRQIEEDKKKKAAEAPVPPVLVVPQASPRKIELTYQYVGICTTDKIPVTTVELDVAGKHFVTAICIVCKNQLDSQEVANLRKKPKI